jgi:hypothetical protein
VAYRDSEALGISDAGDVVVGHEESQACIWTIDAEGGVEQSFLPETSWEYPSKATAISADGSIIVGYNTASAQQAVMWKKVVDGDSTTWEYIVIDEYLDQRHYNRQEFSCQEATAISPDGTIIVGNGNGPDGAGAFRLFLEEERLSGTPVAWGNNDFGETNVPDGLMDVVSLKIAGRYNLALRENGTVVGWGRNDSGEISIPPDLSHVTSVDGGNWHGVALKDDGTVVTWGNNWYGQQDIPDGLDEVLSISAGGSHTLALRTDHTVVAWGEELGGRCDVPQGLADVAAIAAGVFNSVALTWDGTVVEWGTVLNGSIPKPVDLDNVIAISNTRHTLALKDDGTVVAWGDNGMGQCNVPEGLDRVVKAVAGFTHSAALRDDGTVVVWGPDTGGVKDVPPGLDEVIDIAVGGSFTLALKADGTVVAWGWDDSGQTDVPADLADVFAIHAGSVWGVALVEVDDVPPPPVPALTVSTNFLLTHCPEGEDAMADFIQVTNTGDGTMSFSVESDVAWIEPSPPVGESSGSAQSIDILYHTSTLAAGDYEGIVTVTAEGADGSPKQVMVSLSVMELTPPDNWGAFDRLDGDFVDTGDWMGWFWIGEAPWVWCYTMSKWIYVPDASAEAGVGWVYIPK